MTPSNPTNSQPLIYRIADKLGVFHLVAPVDHTHLTTEVSGLTEALAAKANAAAVETALAGKQNTLNFDTTPTANSTNPVTSGGVKAALDGKTGISRGNNGWVEVKDNGQVEIIGDQSVYIGISDMDGALFTLDNIGNLQRALTNPDTTPTANSNNLVTSGGVKDALDNKTSLSHEDISSEVGILIKHQGDDEYDQAEVIGKDRIVFGVGENASDGSAIVNASNFANLQRALTNPDTTPTANSNNLVTSGGVKAALANKMDNKTIDSTPTLNSQNLVTSGGVAAALNSKAGATHTHIPTDIAGLVPSFVETAGDAIDMDDLINDEVGLKRLIIKNVSGGNIQFGNLLTSPTLPVHPNANASTQIDDGDYALVTIYKIDKDMDMEDEHEHDLCYFVTLDGIFGPV